MKLFHKQLVLAAGAAAAFAVLALLFAAAPRFMGRAWLPQDDPASRLVFTARWLVVPGVALLVGVIGAARRGFSADAIDGTPAPSDWSLEVNLRYNRNTLEQTVLAAIAWAALAVSLPGQRLFLIPTMALAFGLGRVAFWIGYLAHPLARAFGMTLTVAPTMAAYLWLIWRAFSPR